MNTDISFIREKGGSHLTVKHLLIGKLYHLFGAFWDKKRTRRGAIPKGYTLLSRFPVIKNNSRWSTGIFKTMKGKKVVIKEYSYTFPDLNYQHLVNEANALVLFKNRPRKEDGSAHIQFPKLEKIIHTKNELIVITEHAQGKLLKHCSENIKLQVLQACLQTMPKLTKRLSDISLLTLAKRYTFQFTISIAYYWLLCIMKDPANARMYTKALIHFYTAVCTRNFHKRDWTISHRDLSSKNILVQRKQITLLDLEFVVIADRLTDVSIIARLYIKEIQLEKLIQFLRNVLDVKKDKEKFTALTLYYAMQTAGVCDADSPFFAESREYLNHFFKNISPAVFGV